MREKNSWFWRRIGFMVLGMSWFVSTAFAQTESFLVTVVDARIAPTKSDGKAWDLGFFRSKLPDPFVVITAGKYTLRTPVVRNSLSPRWNISQTWVLPDNQKVSIRVWDHDRLSKNDLIGQTDTTFKELRQYESLTFGQVLALQIKVVSLSPQPRIIPPPLVEQPHPRPRVVTPPPEHREPELRTVPPRTSPPTETRPQPPQREATPQPPQRETAPQPTQRETTPQPPQREPERPPVPAERRQPVPPVVAQPTDEVRHFCLVMIQQSLTCMKKQEEIFLKSGDPKQIRMATALHHALKVAEKAMQERGRALESMISRCRLTIQREGWVVSARCIACAQRQGCVRSHVLKSACRDVCLTPKAANGLPTAPPLLPPPVRRDAQQDAPAPTTPPAPRTTEPRNQPAPERRNNPGVEPPSHKESALPSSKHPNLVTASADNESVPAPKSTKTTPSKPVVAKPTLVLREAPASKPVSRPVVATISVEQFCQKFLEQRTRCLTDVLAREQKQSKRSDLHDIELIKTMVRRLQTTQTSLLKQCVKRMKQEQERRKGSTQRPLSSTQLVICWACLQKADCNPSQQQLCRSVCVE